jgi:hypothetical protein
MEVGPEVNAEKASMYMLLSCHQNAGLNHGTNAANRFCENIA